ncbi:replication protein [Metabacillus halosaccharovorans]|uniref:Replication protein n=1 Tax=Metabacillus halosaccharovorans TaxID=930124 RepID=A0ABT3DCK6_9BACI|nr:replication protein [Metabacillus halosaccharovorans]MCV9884724.1 replication protein [Metabacillus halosaccharovorans]
MASPQTKNGYTRIANEILENIAKTDLNGTQLRIVMVIWRYTYGFRRKEYEMSLAFLSETINRSRSHVDKELASLIDRNIISVVGVGKRRGRVLSFNKNYDEWDDKSQPKQPEPPKEPKKPKINKKPKYDENNSYFKMALYFHKLVSEVAKEAGVEHLIKKANMQSWADDFRKLIELDGIDKHLAKDVMDWVTKDSFWKTNVLSAKKLREKFGELAIKMKALQKPKNQINTAAQKQAHPNDATRDKEIEFQQWIMKGNDPNEFDWR